MKRTHSVLTAAAAIAALMVGGTAAAGAAPVPRDTPKVATSASSTDAGIAATAARFTALTPVRVLDTRDGGGAPVGPGGVRTVDLSALVPATGTAVVLNVTGTEPTASTFVTVFPGGGTMPVVSNLNLVPGQTRPNAVTVALGAGRTISLYNFQGSTHLIADLVGYYDSAAGAGFTSMRPQRALDTRSGSPVAGGTTITVDLSPWLAPGATAATLNLTGLDATWPTFVTAWPTGQPRPVASALNLVPGEITPNQVTVAVDANRRINLYNHSGFTNLIVDVAGYYAPGGLAFFQLHPERVYDSRFDPPPWGPDEFYRMSFANVVPADTQAVVFNLTGTNTTASTFVTAGPPALPIPASSNLNLAAGQTAPNLVVVETGFSVDGPQTFLVYNRNGWVDLIFDLAGYFAPAPL